MTPFRTLLVANRGEIALRIMSTARRMGYGTVAVYSSADAESRHVRAADKAVLIGGPRPAESYLNIPAIIAAAREAGADAVHPGYGFLAENAGFAEACRQAGLVFVGPTPQSIEAMGDKARAKAIMQVAGVPVVPGYQGEDQSEARFLKEAETIGYPIMIKAVAGGGGRGMRLVPDAASLPGLLASARSEAENAFGDPTVLIEKAIIEPRHIEIQVFGDRHGNAIHLGERDCSVQRRHQKVIEEAPSPAVSPALRDQMGEVSVKAVQALAYEGAGTLEFLLDREGHFYFMEMNTRLQVEHPVTEAITGLDLVEWQLRVAAGEALPLAQHEVRTSGHAIEVRLCAEDPAHDFRPQSGRFLRWQAPAGLRTETAMASGAEVPPFYDSMVAKLIAHGPTRDAARRSLIEGLNRLEALGVTTNQGFLARALAHPVFAEGEATTAFVGAHGAALAEPAPASPSAAALAAFALFVTDAAPRYLARARHLGPPLPVPLTMEIGGKTVAAAVHRTREGTYQVEAEGETVTLALDRREPEALHVKLDTLTLSLPVARAGADLFLGRGADVIHVRDLTRAAATATLPDGSDGRLVAAMNGRIVAVHAALGEAIAIGQPLVTLEAMKMEHIHRAPVAGTLAEIAVAAGDQVTTGRLLAAIEKTAEA